MEMFCNHLNGNLELQKSCFYEGPPVESYTTMNPLNYTQELLNLEEVEDYNLNEEAKPDLMVKLCVVFLS